MRHSIVKQDVAEVDELYSNRTYVQHKTIMIEYEGLIPDDWHRPKPDQQNDFPNMVKVSDLNEDGTQDQGDSKAKYVKYGEQWEKPEKGQTEAHVEEETEDEVHQDVKSEGKDHCKAVCQLDVVPIDLYILEQIALHLQRFHSSFGHFKEESPNDDSHEQV